MCINLFITCVPVTSIFPNILFVWPIAFHLCFLQICNTNSYVCSWNVNNFFFGSRATVPTTIVCVTHNMPYVYFLHIKQNGLCVPVTCQYFHYFGDCPTFCLYALWYHYYLLACVTLQYFPNSGDSFNSLVIVPAGTIWIFLCNKFMMMLH
jgi:hypothetical protein